MKSYKLLSTLFFLTFSITVSFAQSYIVVAKPGKIYDEPNTKYVTLNTENQELSVVPGMVFKQTEKTPGWVMIEYSPGLRAYLQETLLASQLKTPVPGVYTVKNNPSQKFNVTQEGENWAGNVNEKNYKGKKFNNVVVFFDEQNNPAYTLADPGEGGIIIDYNDKVTKFF